MCGITGKIYFTDSRVLIADIERMSTAVAHRGPDDAGSYISPNKKVGLGHRRLSIIDPSAAGHQPMRYYNRYVITFNGEIYNYSLLRQKLIDRGYTFQSTTDTEVILALYAEFGAKCVEYLNGMFAFAIYDEHTQTLFCARDRMGKKPFKYFYDHRVFMFASEIKSLLTQSEIRPEADIAALHEYITFQYIPSPATGFNNIKKLPPAHTLTLNTLTGQVVIKSYWSLSHTPDTNRSESEWIQDIRSAVTSAVRARLVADVPLGAFLSGGVDSSAIVALMAQASALPIKTFSIGFADAAQDETQYARLVAQHYHTDHTELRITPDPTKIVSILQTHFDEPFADSSAIPTYYLCQLARQHVTVALTGDGGDELFAGYRHYIAHRLAARLARIPGTEYLGAVAAPYLTARAQRFALSISQSPAHRHHTYITNFPPHIQHQLYGARLAAHAATPTAITLIPTADPVTAAVAYDIATYLPDDILTKVDMMSMAVGLETRSPLLDHNVVSLIARIPAALKLRGLTGKYIWKQAVRDLVPKALLNRPKHGFTVPLSSWLRGPLRELLTTTLTSQASQQRDVFNPRQIQQLLTLHQQGHTFLARPLWSLLTLELWFQKYIDRR